MILKRMMRKEISSVSTSYNVFKRIKKHEFEECEDFLRIQQAGQI